MNLKKSVCAALFAAFTAVASQIAIPIQPVPINLAVAAVILSGALLGWKYGTASVLVYILLGCVGVPVFSGLRGGLQVIAGVTGGYIVGYVLIALIVGIVSERSKRVLPFVLSAAAGVALCYILGTAWYCVLTSTPVLAALSACVLPFLPGDAVKIALSAIIFKKTSGAKILEKLGL